jgi:hypothetical protein
MKKETKPFRNFTDLCVYKQVSCDLLPYFTFFQAVAEGMESSAKDDQNGIPLNY